MSTQTRRVAVDTNFIFNVSITLFFSTHTAGSSLAFSGNERSCERRSERTEEIAMQTMLQGLVVIGGLTVSLTASLLIEELIFRQIVHVAFVRRPQISKKV